MSHRHILVSWTLGKYFNLPTPQYKISVEHYSEPSALFETEGSAFVKSQRHNSCPRKRSISSGDGLPTNGHKIIPH